MNQLFIFFLQLYLRGEKLSPCQSGFPVFGTIRATELLNPSRRVIITLMGGVFVFVPTDDPSWRPNVDN